MYLRHRAFGSPENRPVVRLTCMSDSAWLRSDRLALRPFMRDDLDWLEELYADPDVTRYLGGLKSRAQTEEHLNTRILRYYDDHPGLGDLPVFFGPVLSGERRRSD